MVLETSRFARSGFSMDHREESVPVEVTVQVNSVTAINIKRILGKFEERFRVFRYSLGGLGGVFLDFRGVFR